eukprot:GHVN01073305.1.p2 GENE.GHVN01073305.1~~GHVN01073305.1.p2  ORF type:complete len:183 (+),score=24.70 GHVN01073305.1:1246-1794(+)
MMVNFAKWDAVELQAKWKDGFLSLMFTPSEFCNFTVWNLYEQIYCKTAVPADKQKLLLVVDAKKRAPSSDDRLCDLFYQLKPGFALKPTAQPPTRSLTLVDKQQGFWEGYDSEEKVLLAGFMLVGTPEGQHLPPSGMTPVTNSNSDESPYPSYDPVAMVMAEIEKENEAAGTKKSGRDATNS